MNWCFQICKIYFKFKVSSGTQQHVVTPAELHFAKKLVSNFLTFDIVFFLQHYFCCGALRQRFTVAIRTKASLSCLLLRDIFFNQNDVDRKLWLCRGGKRSVVTGSVHTNLVKDIKELYPEQYSPLVQGEISLSLKTCSQLCAYSNFLWTKKTLLG